MCKAEDIESKRKAFLVDTDAGNFSDDFWALALQLCDPWIDIRLVVTSGFETRLKTKVVAKFLTHCGRGDVPIACGIETPECPYLLPDEDGLLQQHPEYEEGAVTNPVLRRWAADYDLSKYKGGIFGTDSEEGHGMKKVEAIINETPDLTYLIQGSSENVGHLLDNDADLFRRNRVRIVCMGGALEKEHEYNFSLDPINTRRMLACCDDITVVPVEPAFQAKLSGIGQMDKSENPEHSSYGVYLRGDSRISMAMAQLQLALANYGTHKEVADGETDIMFDGVAAFVASGRRRELYVVENIIATIDDKGRIHPAAVVSNDSLSFAIMTKWVSLEAVNEFKYLVAETIACGTYTT